MVTGLREERRVASAWLASFAFHVVLLGGAGLLVARGLIAERAPMPRALSFAAPAERTYEIELPQVAEGSIAETKTQAPVAPHAAPRGGGEGTPRLDTGKEGRGGTDTAERPAINLADRDEGLLLSRELASRFDRSQIQRLRSAKERASREDWRASREPMELTFFASGTGLTGQSERRNPSPFDPSSGARESADPSKRGTALGGREGPAGVGLSAHDVGSPDEGGDRASAGLGVRDGAPGFDHRDSARVPLARPMVPEGTPSIPAEAKGKPRDTTDSEQEVATMMQSLVHASTAGGAAGQGPGGQRGPGATGAGGKSGPGSIARALGSGAGPGLDVDPRDQRRNLYLRGVHQKVYPLWSFPKWAGLEGMQGTVIVNVVIQADGSVASARVTRPSGIAEFDESCRKATLRAAPYGPLPAELGPQLSVSLSCDAKNPAVRPKTTAAVSPAGSSQD